MINKTTMHVMFITPLRALVYVDIILWKPFIDGRY